MQRRMQLVAQSGRNGGGEAALRFCLAALFAVAGYLVFVHLPNYLGGYLSSERATYFFDPSTGPRGVETHISERPEQTARVTALQCAPTTADEKAQHGDFPRRCHALRSRAPSTDQEATLVAKATQAWIVQIYRPLPTEAGDHFSHAFARERMAFGTLSEDQVIGLLKVVVGILLVLTLHSTISANRANAKSSRSNHAVTVILVMLPVIAVLVYAFILNAMGAATVGGVASAEALGIGIWRGLFIAPIAEELFFRVWLLTLFEKYSGPKRAVLLSTLVFAVSHSPFHWITGLYFVVGGALLGTLWVKRRSVPLNILAHALANGTVLALTQTLP